MTARAGFCLGPLVTRLRRALRIVLHEILTPAVDEGLHIH